MLLTSLSHGAVHIQRAGIAQRKGTSTHLIFGSILFLLLLLLSIADPAWNVKYSKKKIFPLSELYCSQQYNRHFGDDAATNNKPTAAKSPSQCSDTSFNLPTDFLSAQKPFEKWTAREVQEWMKKEPDFQDKALRAKFFFTGEAIASFTKQQFRDIAKSDGMGIVLYNAVMKLKTPQGK